MAGRCTLEDEQLSLEEFEPMPTAVQVQADLITTTSLVQPLNLNGSGPTHHHHRHHHL